MTITDCYDFEKTKEKSVVIGEIIEGFKVSYTGEGVVLVDSNCKKCGQQLRLFEALGYDDLCEECQ